MQVALTGDKGFLGKHIVPALEQSGHTVKTFDKRGESPVKVEDLNVRDLMGCDAVIHLAWRTNIPDCKRHPEGSTRDNINMSVHLIEVAKEAGVTKFIFPSTASLYGNNPLPWTEDMKPEPIEPYSWQKYSVEEYLKMSDLEWIIPRFFQVYGEYQREDTALAAFLRSKRENKPVTLTETQAQSKFKSGQRDFIYAGDLARAIVFLLERGDKGTYNIASGEVKTMEDIANALEAEVKWIPRRPYEVERHEADISKIKALGWRPLVDVTNWLRDQI